MKLIFPLLLGTFITPAFAANVEGFKKDYPTEEVSKQTTDDKIFHRALEAYRYWYPTVSAEGIMNGVEKQKISLFTAVGDSSQLAFTANIDTPYGSGVLDLSNGPIVIDVPPGKYMGLVNDHNQDWIIDMGLPGEDKGQGGKYLILPPDYNKKIPVGYFVGRSSTNKILPVFRAIPEDGNMETGIKMINNIKIYPYSTAKNPVTLNFADVRDKKIDFTLLQWEDNIGYWKALHKVINEEPLNEKFFPMYGMLSSIGIEKGKPFPKNERIISMLTKVAEEGKKQLLVTAYNQYTRPDRIAWKDRKWEWLTLVPGTGNFTFKNSQDLEARERYFSQAIVMSPAMTIRNEGAGSLYWGAYRDNKGKFLEGDKTYKMTVPLPVPAELFWSITLYDADTRSLIATDQKSGLRSLVELNNLGNKKSIDLYFGPKVPVGQEKFWVKTNPAKGWFAYFRIYGPSKNAFNEKWKPGDFVEVQTDTTANLNLK